MKSEQRRSRYELLLPNVHNRVLAQPGIACRITPSAIHAVTVRVDMKSEAGKTELIQGSQL